MARGQGPAAGKHAGQYCIDVLPDDLIRRILPRLPLEGAVWAGVLARRWLNASAQVRLYGGVAVANARYGGFASLDQSALERARRWRNASAQVRLYGVVAVANARYGGSASLDESALERDVPTRARLEVGAAADPARLHYRTAGAGRDLSTGDRLSNLSDGVLTNLLQHLPHVEAARTALLSQRWRYLWRLLPRLVFDDRDEDPNGEEEVGEEGVDRISDLPDDVLLRIVSRIPSIDVIQTCVLAHRWRVVWTSLPRLKFDDAAVAAAGIRSFADFVNGALERHDPNVSLEGLLIRVTDPANLNPANLAAWAAYAALRVRGSFSLQLSLGDELEEVLVLELPGHANAKWISLSVTIPEDVEVRMLLDEPGEFLHLSRLMLHGARFTDGGSSISCIVSTLCPCLEMIDMFDVRGVRELKFCTKSLTKLSLSHVCLDTLNINAPNLMEVVIRASILVLEGKTVMLNAPNLETVLWRDICPNNAQIVKTHPKKLEARYIRLRGGEGTTSLQNLFVCFPDVDVLEICAYINEDMVKFEKLIHSLKLPLHASFDVKRYSH